jgi:hypothetical protein
MKTIKKIIIYVLVFLGLVAASFAQVPEKGVWEFNANQTMKDYQLDEGMNARNQRSLEKNLEEVVGGFEITVFGEDVLMYDAKTNKFVIDTQYREGKDGRLILKENPTDYELYYKKGNFYVYSKKDGMLWATLTPKYPIYENRGF